MNLLSLAAYDLKLCCVSVCLSTLRESLRQYLALKDNHSLNVILGILFSSHTPPRMYSRCYFCNKISIFSSYFHLVQVCKLQNTLLHGARVSQTGTGEGLTDNFIIIIQTGYTILDTRAMADTGPGMEMWES